MCDSTSEDGIEARVDVIPFHESLLASGDGVVIPSLYVVLFEPLDSGWDGDLGITCGTSRCLARLASGTLHCFFRVVQEAFGSIREKAATTCTCDRNVVGGVRPAFFIWISDCVLCSTSVDKTKYVSDHLLVGRCEMLFIPNQELVPLLLFF